MNDEQLLINAIERVSILVDDVIETIVEVADDNDFERDWVIEQFRKRFNAAIKE